MWKLKTIEAENLCAFRSLSYMLRQGVTTLIFGDNRDNESQQSNGAGKSALLECIAVGITGSPLRKIRSEEIINDAAEECRIALRFINDSAAEELLVNRRIPRKGASSVSCTLYRGGKQVVTDEAVQPSVDAYNRYILDKLGITRDELLNNFILSKYRYEDFLSSSDKEKKEVINRFSNGILVDEAIAKVEEDIVPLSEKKRQVELELAGLDGRIGMLQEQIRKEEEAGAERGRTRVERIMGLETAIAAKREQIRTGHENVDRLEEQLAGVQRADEALQELEAGDTALEACLEKIAEMMSLFPDARQTDWDKVIAGHHPIYAETPKDESERADMQARLDPILRKHKVDMYICGHIHNFQHVRVAGSDIDYITNSAGSLARKVKPIEGTVFCSPEPGFSIVSASKKTLELRMIDKKGNVLHTVTRSK